MVTDLRDILLEAIEIAGSIHKEIYEKEEIRNKDKYKQGNPSDVVTQADILSETALRDFFARVLPEYNVLGEEFGGTYNGNGKVIFVDPLDGTKSFVERRPYFGTVIGVYENGKNIGGVISNTLQNVQYVATSDTTFERHGSIETEKGVIYLSGKLPGNNTFATEAAELLQKEFPDKKIVVYVQDVLGKAHVFQGDWCAYFHPGLAVHDISPVPLFAEKTGVLVTDHNGVPYLSFDPEEQVKKYATERKEQIYTNPILVAQPKYHAGILKVLQHFKQGLDQKQNP